MENDFRLIRPSTFDDGEEYLLKKQSEGEPGLVLVTFIAYDACPAFVIIRNCSGRLRCLRDDLFVYSDAMAVSHRKLSSVL
jgi:hypothetical protein